MSDRRDRAQLILVGAVVIAIALIGMATVFNSIVLTASLAPQGAKTSTSDASMYRQAAQQDLQQLFDRVANDSAYPTEPALASNATRYSHRLAEVAANDGPRYVNVSLNGTTSATRSRIVQHNSKQIRNRAGDKNWTINPSTPTNVTELQIKLQLSQTSATTSQPFYVEVENSTTGDWWNLTVYSNPPDQTTFTTRNNAGPLTTCNLGDTGVAVINLTSVSGPSTTCPGIDFATGVDPPYAISITRGNKVEGSYQITTDTTLSSSNYYSSPTQGDPYLVDVVKTARFDFVYRDNRLAYRTQLRVEAEGSP